MTARAGLRARWIALVTVVIAMAGATGAAAHWTARTSVNSTAAAADIGLEQSVLPATGDVPAIYSTATPTLGRAVTITNTGNREAAFTLTVRVGSSTSSSLPADVRVELAAVGEGADCDPRRTLAGSRTGSLAEDLDLTGDLPAGETVTLCVHTTLEPAVQRAHSDAQLEIELDAALVYAETEQWILEADDPMTIAQRVAGSPFSGVQQMRAGQGQAPFHLQLTFVENSGHPDKKAIQYRVLLAPENAPEKRTLYRNDALTGEYTTVHVQNTSPEMAAYVSSAGGGPANIWVIVEHRLPGDQEWSTAAVGRIHAVQEEWWIGIHHEWR